MILSQKESPVAFVSDLTCIYSELFSHEQYISHLQLLKQAKVNEPSGCDSKEKKNFYEYLSVYQFKNDESTEFIVTIYDSDELWQDPQYIDIFLFNPASANIRFRNQGCRK